MIAGDALSIHRAEDVAYTINHAFVCSLTDFIDPFVGNATQNWLGKRVSIGCGHDHEHFHDEHSCATDAHGNSKLGHWWLGEIAGDFGAVPVTIAVQRYASPVMDGLRKVLETVAGPILRRSAMRSAHREASAFGAQPDAQAVAARAEELYAHEIYHLPQAAVWTASSVMLNVGTQKLAGNTAPLWHIASGKLVGTGVSSLLTLTARTLAPATAQKWDRFSSEHVYLPVSKKVAAAFGVDKHTVERVAEKERATQPSNWVERTAKQPETSRTR
jgi:hypothetical protein